MTEASIAARLEADSFSHPVTHLYLRETPISWVVLTGPYAYKIKKPVRLPFLDASTLARRQLLCLEELRLNRRYARDLYLDVVPIGEHNGRLQVGTTGPALEYAVRMHEFESDQELSQQLTLGAVSCAEMAEFGQRLSDWHQSAAVARPDEGYATAKLIETQLLENFDAMRNDWSNLQATLLEQLEQWSRGELGRLSDRLQQRLSSGYVRECHGDLHAGNIVRWRGQWLPFDCLEFEPRLRWIDGINDVAFLYMDLLCYRREELAYAFLSGYLEQSGDYEALPLLALYSVYRALVRAKVCALRPVADPLERPTAGNRPPPVPEPPQRLALAKRLAQPRAPVLLLMHGVSASGKSYLSGRLVGALGAVRVRSDLERRRLVGAGDYSPGATLATYERLRACAQTALESGECIIVDAAFLDPRQRCAFEQLASRYACPCLIISCRAPPETLRTRLAARAQAAHDPSEATREVLERQLAQDQPFTASDSADLIAVDTSSSENIDYWIEKIRARLSRSPRFSEPWQHRESAPRIGR